MSGDYLYDLLQELGLSNLAARTGQFVIEVVLVLLVATFVARVASRLARRSIESLIARSTLPGVPARSKARAATLGGVCASVVRILVWTLAFLIVIGQVGINLGPFVAGASIVGVAVGFGAQSLVKDFLSGFFILAEDQFGVGDTVTVSDVSGTVEEVNLRVTRLRGSDGTVWFVPNGEIRKVGNAAKDWSRAIVDVVLPVGTDIAAATASVSAAVAQLAGDAAWADAVLEPPEVLGVEDLSPDGTTLRVTAKTRADQRARVARALRAGIAERLQKDGLLPAKEASSAVGAAPGDDPAANHPAANHPAANHPAANDPAGGGVSG